MVDDGSAPGREVFISFSSLLSQFSGDPNLLEKIPESALFFFGSKRSWVFPETAEELKEAKGQNPRYRRPEYQPLRDLVLAKEARDQVFWLKPPGFVYNGNLFHGHPDAFRLASEWLQRQDDPVTGAKYRPLLLEPAWWKTKFDPKQAKHYDRVETIIKNFQCGAHDYGPVMELLHQSNPTLLIAD